MAELRKSNARYDTITRHGREVGTEVERMAVSECRIPRADVARARTIVAYGLSFPAPRDLADSTSDLTDPYWVRWSNSAGASLTLDFRLGAKPYKRFWMAQHSTCAAKIGGYGVEVVRGRTTDGRFMFTARWLGIGGPPSAPSGNTFMFVGRAATDTEREALLAHAIMVQRAR